MDDNSPTPDSPEPTDATTPIPLPPIVEAADTTEAIAAAPAPFDAGTSRPAWSGRKIAAAAAAGALTLGAGFAIGSVVSGDGHDGRDGGQSVDGQRGQYEEADGDSTGVPGSITPAGGRMVRGGHMDGSRMQPGQGMQGGMGGQMPQTRSGGS